MSFANKQPPKKKRKSRTAFTNHQIFELEKRFLYQKYLSPADRDEIAASLGLSNAQVTFVSDFSFSTIHTNFNSKGICLQSKKRIEGSTPRVKSMIIYRMAIVEGRCDKLQLLISYIYNHWLTQKYSEF